MALPPTVIDVLLENAKNNGAQPPQDGDNLFKTGVLDSFALVDFIGVLEQECGIKVPDSDVNPANFETLRAIEHYVETHRN
jgi:acyl carrier protein